MNTLYAGAEAEGADGAGSGKAELAKAGQLYHEIQSLRVETSLDGLDVVEGEVKWISEAGQQIRQEAFKNLDAGMAALNQAEVGSTLQVGEALLCNPTTFGRMAQYHMPLSGRSFSTWAS